MNAPSGTAEPSYWPALFARLLSVGAVSVALYGALYLHIDRPLAAAVEFAYLTLVVGTLAWLRVRPSITRWGIGVHIGLVFAVITGVSALLGGLLPSGAFMLWGLIAPLAAMIFLGWRVTALVFTAYAALLLLATGMTADHPWVDPLPAELVAPLTAANCIGSTVLVFTALTYFLRQIERDRQERERIRARAATLSDALLRASRDPSVHAGELNSALRAIATAAARALDVDRCGVWLYEPDDPAIRCVQTSAGEGDRDSVGVTLRMADYPAYFAALHEHRIVAADDAIHDRRTREFARDYLIPHGIGAMLDAPVRREGRLTAVVCHEHLGAPRHWSRDEKTFAASIGDLVALAVEASEYRRSEAQRAAVEERLWQAQKLESLGVLAGGIAHDFNNLLVAILGHADRALVALDDDREPASNVRSIEVAGRRAADLCQQLLAYSGRGSFVVAPLDVNRIVADVGELLALSIARLPSVRYTLTDGLPAVEADATQLRQVLVNLLSNASEALDDGEGTIEVRTAAIERDEAALARTYYAAGEPGRYVVIEVADSGHGMDEETRERLFDPFFSTRFAGRGLGMAAVLGIVRGHDGAIEVDSAPGQGTTVRVLLPASDALVEEPSEPSTARERWQETGTVLLVDDEELVRETVGRMLRDIGYDVVLADDGVEAVRRFGDDPTSVDCVVLDLTMPRMDGEETFHALRALRADLPVLLTSGYSSQEIAHLLDGSARVGFIQKPYRIEELVASIRDVAGS